MLAAVRNLLRRERADRELDDELLAFVELLADEKAAGGMSRDAALRAARAEVGVEEVKEEVRAARAGAWIGTVWRDARLAARSLANVPVFTLVAVCSLALGIGGNAAMFTLVDALLLRPLPYPEPERLVRATGFYPKGAVAELRRRMTTADVAGFSSDAEFNLAAPGGALHLSGSAVSSNLFDVLGARAEVGRALEPGDEGDDVVALGDALWRREYGADPGVVGRAITIDGVARRVVGVMPADFAFPSPEAQVWTPYRVDLANEGDAWGSGFMPVVARLRPGATRETAAAELRAVMPDVIAAFPYQMVRSWNEDADVVSLQQEVAGDVRTRILALQWAVGLVLLVACVNVASLSLARASTRRKEMNLRSALGATRARVARQLLTESLVLALFGGALGLALASGAVQAVTSAAAPNAPRLAGARVDWTVALLVAGLAVVSGVVSGVAPALSASRTNAGELIKASGRRFATAADVRLRNVLVAGEVAAAFALLVCAGLLIRSVWQLARVNPGFVPDRVVTVRVFPNPTSEDRDARVAFYDELLRRSRAIPGVAEVAAANAIPLDGETPTVPVEMEGHPIRPAEEFAPTLWAEAVTPEYFRVMRVPVVEGRAFTDADAAGAPLVAVVSAATAARFWPGEDPVGKRVRVVWDREWRTVVGVAGDVRQHDLSGDAPSTDGVFYLPYPQSVGNDRRMPTTMTLLASTAADPERVAADVRGAVGEIGPGVPVGDVRTMDSVVSASAARHRSLAWLFAAFAGSALALVAIGVYGVVAYATAQRTYEIGVRVALGATRRDVYALVLRRSLSPIVAGLAVGAVASLGLARTISGFLFDVTATDPATYAAVAALVFGVAALAAYVPVRRAASVDPARALRVD